MQRTYRAHCELVAGKRWKDLQAKGARKQRMLWASTGTKDPEVAAGPVCRGAGRAGHDRYHAGKNLAGVRTERQAQRRHAYRRRRRGSRCWHALLARASTSMRSPPGCRSRAPPRSSSRGPNSCSASRTRAPHWRPLEFAAEPARRQAGARGLAGRCAALDHGVLQRTAGSRRSRRNGWHSAPRGIAEALSTSASTRLMCLAISQAICEYRKRHGIEGPLFMGFDTHALSAPAFVSALEVLAANGVEVMIAAQDEYTPTPAISHAILTYNRAAAAASRTASSSRRRTTRPTTAASSTTRPTAVLRIRTSPSGSRIGRTNCCGRTRPASSEWRTARHGARQPPTRTTT